MQVTTLKKRSDFQRIQSSSLKIATKSLVLYAAPANHNEEKTLRVGLTITKKVGNAVIRNRIRRRFRVLTRRVMPSLAPEGFDYVVIGRKAAIDREFSGLEKDLRYALHTLQKTTSDLASAS